MYYRQTRRKPGTQSYEAKAKCYAGPAAIINSYICSVYTCSFFICQNKKIKAGNFMNNPKIQIIIPVYNASKYIRKCLDSVKNQTYESWEALLIDDASTDNSSDIIKEYTENDNRFKYIRQEKNSGAASARNKGLSMLTAEYVAFLDSDDYWENTMLEELLNHAEESSCDIVQCRFIYDFPGGKQILPTGAFPKNITLSGDGLKKVYFKMMTGINMNHVCMKLIKTQIIGDLRFDTSLKTAEDLKFCINLFKKVKSYCFINSVLYHYCRNSDSITGSGLPVGERYRANHAVSAELVSSLPEWNMDNLFYRTVSKARPYIITVSKVFRIMREKLSTRK